MARPRRARAAPATAPDRSPAELLHDLQVHQAELELQNEELRRSQVALEAARDEFVELYDAAPVGYVSVDAAGRLVAVNLAGARALGEPRDALLGRRFDRLVVPADRPRWAQHLAAVRRADEARVCELRLARADGSAFPVHLTSARRHASGGEEAARQVRSTFVDMTEQREAEAELRRSREALRALAGRLQSVREEEGARLARDLHDDLGQTLTALQLDLKGIERALERLAPNALHGDLLDRVVGASELAASTLGTLRRIAQDLHPSVLDHLGLAAALRNELGRFEERTGVRVAASLEADAPPGDPAGKALFRICQEALTNVARHAGARHVEIGLRARPGELVLEVLVDGVGLAPGRAGAPGSLGLLAMRERALALGGEVTLLARPGGGTAVTARVATGRP